MSGETYKKLTPVGSRAVTYESPQFQMKLHKVNYRHLD